jgi:hypothetical protein
MGDCPAEVDWRFIIFVNRQNGAVAICFSEEAKEIKILF